MLTSCGCFKEPTFVQASDDINLLLSDQLLFRIIKVRTLSEDGLLFRASV
jgi:hypothetical protein